MDSKALALSAGLPTAVSRHVDKQQDLHRSLAARRWQQLPKRFAHQHPGVAHYADASLEAPAEARVHETVGDIMTTAVVSVTPESTVMEALDLIVKHRITGMPVVDKDGKVVGVVSDFDLLALDLDPDNSPGMFPSLDESWEAFRNVQLLMSKVEGKIVDDVMSTDPLTIRPSTSLDMASRLLLQSKIRRLPVVDKDGKLIGLLSRRNIIVAALAERKMKQGAMLGTVGRVA